MKRRERSIRIHFRKTVCHVRRKNGSNSDGIVSELYTDDARYAEPRFADMHLYQNFYKRSIEKINGSQFFLFGQKNVGDILVGW